MKSTQVVFRFDFVTVPERFFWFNNYKAGKKGTLSNIRILGEATSGHIRLHVGNEHIGGPKKYVDV
jgi:hypothetical protein